MEKFNRWWWSKGNGDYDEQEENRPKKRNLPTPRVQVPQPIAHVQVSQPTQHYQLDDSQIEALFFSKESVPIYIKHETQSRGDINALLGEFDGQINIDQVYLPHESEPNAFECITEIVLNRLIETDFTQWYNGINSPLGKLMDNSTIALESIVKLKPEGKIINQNMSRLAKATLLIKFEINPRTAGSGLLRGGAKSIDLTSTLFTETFEKAVQWYILAVLEIEEGRFETKYFMATNCLTIKLFNKEDFPKCYNSCYATKTKFGITFHMQYGASEPNAVFKTQRFDYTGKFRHHIPTIPGITRFIGSLIERNDTAIEVYGVSRTFGKIDKDNWDTMWMVHVDKNTAIALENRDEWRLHPKRDLSDWKQREAARDALPKTYEIKKKNVENPKDSSNRSAEEPMDNSA